MNYQVSLEGETAELNDKIRGIGAYARAMQGVKNLIDAGMNVTLAITLTRKNHGHLLDFFKLAHSIGIKQVKLSAFIPTGTGSELNETHSLTRDINHEIANEILKITQLYPAIKIIASAFIKEAKWYSMKEANRSTFGCGAGTTTLVINSDLSLSACDMMVEKQGTQPVSTPTDISSLWTTDPLLLRWRGVLLPSTQNKYAFSFNEVHQHGCQVAYNVYKENIFE